MFLYNYSATLISRPIGGRKIIFLVNHILRQAFQLIYQNLFLLDKKIYQKTCTDQLDCFKILQFITFILFLKISILSQQIKQQNFSLGYNQDLICVATMYDRSYFPKTDPIFSFTKYFASCQRYYILTPCFQNSFAKLQNCSALYTFCWQTKKSVVGLSTSIFMEQQDKKMFSISLRSTHQGCTIVDIISSCFYCVKLTNQINKSKTCCILFCNYLVIHCIELAKQIKFLKISVKSKFYFFNAAFQIYCKQVLLSVLFFTTIYVYYFTLYKFVQYNLYYFYYYSFYNFFKQNFCVYKQISRISPYRGWAMSYILHKKCGTQRQCLNSLYFVLLRFLVLRGNSRKYYWVAFSNKIHFHTKFPITFQALDNF
eukprot:TRINITY_DN2917_c0_g1_i15.p1 TRINITY_DN2917_c0_g1~~TRINITY_DN2917_c0_g1_i15.p1  ORF type:complete len:370 (-),score=-34.90 TRINITY_DN2917_c0_g1_i15:113-1222(-)